MEKAILTHVAFLSFRSFWTWVAQDPRDTCRYNKNTSALYSSWNRGAGTKEPAIPATPSEVTHLESQGALALLREKR